MIARALVACALWLTGSWQGVAPVAPEPPPTRASSVPERPPSELLLLRYRTGDAEAAVLEARNVAGLGTWFAAAAGPADEVTASAWLLTEVGMASRSFGRIARSAPLVPVVPRVGLDGMFDVDSLAAYRLIDRAIRMRDAGNASASPVVAGAIRDWFVVTVSYCLRWELLCAAPLLAAAHAAFPDAAEVMLLGGAVAEGKRQWATAELALRRALGARPDLVEARVRLGAVQLARGRPREAITTLMAAVAGAEQQQDAFAQFYGHRALAAAHTRLGQRTRAAEALARAAVVRPFGDATAVRDVAGLSLDELYRSAQHWQRDARVASARAAVRTARPR